MIKKLSISLLSIMILSGCTAEYNLNINKDLLVDESITIKESIFKVRKQELNVDFFVDSNIERYSSNKDYSLYVYEKKIDSSHASVIASTTYLDFLSYKKDSVIINELFSAFNILNDNNIYKFGYKAKPKEDINIFVDDELYSSLFEDLKVNIKLPFRVISSNADSVDINSGVYTWKYTKDGNIKDINIEFDVNKAKIGKTEQGLYFLSGFVIIILALVGYAYYRYRSNNRI